MDFRPLASSSDGCSYLVSSGTHAPLLIDAGLRFAEIRQAMDFKVTGLAGCIVSHCHGDHSKSVRELLGASVDVYASPETWEELRLPVSGLGAHNLTPHKPTQVGPWLVHPFEAVHDAPGTLGFLIAGPEGGRLLYLTDTAYSRYTFEGLTHVCVEANFSNEILRKNISGGRVGKDRYKRTSRNHMSLDRLIGMLKANDLSKVKEIWLLHLSDANSDEIEFKLAVQRATGKPVFIAAKREAVAR